MPQLEDEALNEKNVVLSPSEPLRFAPLLASIGLTLSLYLSFIHARTHFAPAKEAFCSVGELFDCASVAASSSAIFLGVPWALWGVLGFGTLLFVSLGRSIWLLPLSIIAAVASLVLLGLSVFKVGSLCYLCEAVHLVSWILCFIVIRGRNALQGSLSDLNLAASALALPAGLALSLVLFLPPYWGAFSYRADPPFATGTTEDGHAWIGSEAPTLTMHEFTDYNCPHCKARSARTLRRLAKHSDWRIVRRQQPRMRCPIGRESACQAVRVAYCAQEQGKFWRADRWLFAHLQPGKATNVEKIVSDLKLDAQELETCLMSEAIYLRTQKEATTARKARIKDVPGYLIDGKRYRAHELEEFLKARGD